MIKLEHVVLASPEQMEFIIEGMRNSMNSWEKSDSEMLYGDPYCAPEDFKVGDNDHSLMQRLANAGTDHRSHITDEERLSINSQAAKKVLHAKKKAETLEKLLTKVNPSWCIFRKEETQQ